MGGAVSTGEDNNDLVDNLVEADYIKTPIVEKVFRAVDRADYYLPEHRDTAYKDLAWKHGHLHLSAPCIYSEVMESLVLEPGNSFLNLGSGTGYLSTMAGLIIGPYAVNHGVEIHADVVDYARQKLEEFTKKCDAFDEFDFCEPSFVVGNCLQINSGCRLYDRVYCGAACPQEHENYMKNLIRVGGILVMPLNDQLLQIRRTGETEWETKQVLPVSFATLVLPSKNLGNDMVELPDSLMQSRFLQDICRISIRKILRENVLQAHPHLQGIRKKKKKPTKKKSHRRQRMNIVPMSMGMMILGQFDSDDDGHFRLHSSHSDTMRLESDEPDEVEDMAEDDVDENKTDDTMEEDFTETGTSDNGASADVFEDASDVVVTESKLSENGQQESNNNNNCSRNGSKTRDKIRFVTVPEEFPPVQTNGIEEQPRREKLREKQNNNSSCDDSGDDMDFDVVEMLKRHSRHKESQSKLRVRSSSNTSGDTSETSGIGSFSETSAMGSVSETSVLGSLGDEHEGNVLHHLKASPGSSLEDSPLGKDVEEGMDVNVKDEPKDSVGLHMRLCIDELPIPIALKTFLKYYRN
ncbi:protein-L-isoaspartate O-methyltransferase domain-containing protein 1-like [Gigantopelta aegis]|uniref:protein-L-isoaspartate O-methyltransferase domain-containing protein 1-like n=1 Tax=Gigantopelta aegis TaxID=1735272 RepID=UPI001B889ED5|nr:protein-L-isoaspartate O-methyltransferase domain-containing protein 1-like [Gigantopelta aegis]